MPDDEKTQVEPVKEGNVEGGYERPDYVKTTDDVYAVEVVHRQQGVTLLRRGTAHRIIVNQQLDKLAMPEPKIVLMAKTQWDNLLVPYNWSRVIEGIPSEYADAVQMALWRRGYFNKSSTNFTAQDIKFVEHMVTLEVRKAIQLFVKQVQSG